MQPIEQSYKNKSYILDNGLSRGYSHMSDIWERDTQQGGLFTYRNLAGTGYKITSLSLEDIFYWNRDHFSLSSPIIFDQAWVRNHSPRRLWAGHSLIVWNRVAHGFISFEDDMNCGNQRPGDEVLRTRFCVNTTLIFILYFKNSCCGLRWTQQTRLLIIHYYGSL